MRRKGYFLPHLKKEPPRTKENEYKVQSKELEALQEELVWFCQPKPTNSPLVRKEAE